MATRPDADPPPPYPGTGSSLQHDLCQQQEVCSLITSCPNHCDTTGALTSEQLHEHLLNCPLQLVKCKFVSAGCDVMVPRKDLDSHMAENAQQHLMTATLLNLKLTRELHQKMKEKDTQIAELQDQLKYNGYVCYYLVMKKFRKFLRSSESKWVSHVLSDMFESYHFTVEVNTSPAFTHLVVWLNTVNAVSKVNLSSKVKCRVILKMLNRHRNTDHFTVTCDADFSQMYTSHGESKSKRKIGKMDTFYSIDELQSKESEYLHNDEIHFRVYLKTDYFST